MMDAQLGQPCAAVQGLDQQLRADHRAVGAEVQVGHRLAPDELEGAVHVVDREREGAAHQPVPGRSVHPSAEWIAARDPPSDHEVGGGRVGQELADLAQVELQV